MLYVGGLSETVEETVVHAAFIRFGELVEVTIPKENGKNRGFAFVEFKDDIDADEARFNMDGAELFGRVLRVNIAKPRGHKLGSNKPVWSADSWFQNLQEKGTTPAAAAAQTI